MKNKLVQAMKCFAVVFLGVALAMSSVSFAGCGPSDPDESTYDRMPNVPPSTRSQQKGSGAPKAPGEKK